MGHFITAIISMFIGMWLHAEYIANAGSKAAKHAALQVPTFHISPTFVGIVVVTLIIVFIATSSRKKMGAGRKRRR